MAEQGSDLGVELRAMALELIKEVAASPVETKVAAFKALSTFYIQDTKRGKGEPEEDGAPVPSLADMRRNVAAAGEGKVNANGNAAGGDR